MEESKPVGIHVEDDIENSQLKEGAENGTTVMITGYTKRETSKILWKIDWRLIPFLAVLYL